MNRAITLPPTLDTEGEDTNAESDAGSIDWKKLFKAVVRYRDVKHYFVEHEGKMAHPQLGALQIFYAYLQKLPVN